MFQIPLDRNTIKGKINVFNIYTYIYLYSNAKYSM